MKKIVINGGTPLSGKISVSGSKNAALPILFATILTRGVSKIEGLPDIGDIECTLRILRDLGAVISRVDDVTFIDTANLTYAPPKRDDVCRIRASTYLIGACLSRFGECEIWGFGGCNFSDRPIDLHIHAAKALGATPSDTGLFVSRLCGGVIEFPKPSVGATVNAILLAVSAEGESVIRGFAKEPHIDSLIDFLISAGAEISHSDSEIRIKGRKLHGGAICIPGDMIEAGTYLSLGVVTGGEITVSGCPTEHLSAVRDALLSFGAEISESSDGMCARAGNMRPSEIVAAPYPGFPTDLQPIFSVLAARFLGGKVTDTVWQSRFGYLDALSRFGVDFSLENNSAILHPSIFSPATAKAPDLRGGMACIMAALIARGESIIESAETVERGYENLEEKLRALGANLSIREN